MTIECKATPGHFPRGPGVALAYVRAATEAVRLTAKRPLTCSYTVGMTGFE
jgi:hypothetical protein